MSTTEYEFFINELFGNKAEDLWMLIWRLRDKKSLWCQTLSEAAEAIKEDKTNVYVGAGLSSQNWGPGKRCPALAIMGVPGLYADIDVKSPVHKKSNLPETLEEALELVEMSVVGPPTIIVHTGNGIQAWWLFPQIVETRDKDTRKQIAQLERRMILSLKETAAEKGWDVDSTFDLARVLRLPGTINEKEGRKVETKLIKADGPRLDPLKAEELLPELSEVEQRVASVAANGEGRAYSSDDEVSKVLDGLEFKEDAKPELDRFQQLVELFHPKFTQSWRGTRKDLMDDSPSSMDFSVAIFAVRAGWTDQEILELLIYRRKCKGENLKFNNKQYYGRTILGARKIVDKEKTKEKTDVKSAIKVIQERAETDDKGGVKALISEQIGIEYLGGTKFLGDFPTWALIFKTNEKQQEVWFSNIGQLTGRKKFCDKIAESINIVPRPPKGENFIDLINVILQDVEIVLADEQNMLEGKIKAFLKEYLKSREPYTVAQAGGDSFVDRDGHWCVMTRPFMKWIRNNEPDSYMSVNQLNNCFRHFGFEEAQRTFATEETKSGRSSVKGWKLPQSWAAEIE